MPTDRRASTDAPRQDAPETCLGCLLALLFGYEPPSHDDEGDGEGAQA